MKLSPNVKNSVWGLASNLIQNILLSLFFVFIARSYQTTDFALFLIANTLYQMVAAFSTLGLGQWFVREYISSEDKANLVARFLKLQFYTGVFFYLVCIAAAYILYDDAMVRSLSLILGLNVVLDNIIYAIKNLNVARSEQQRTFVILLLDAVLRFVTGLVLLVYPFSIITLSAIVILTRMCTLHLFIKIAVTHVTSLRSIWNSSILWKDVKQLVFTNWAFIILGSISIIYWRSASILISKILPAVDLAHYEVSFKVFILVQIVPLILTSTIFPTLVVISEKGTRSEYKRYYDNAFLLYAGFGILSYIFIYSFSDILITTAFGMQYAGTAEYTRQMFLVMLLFPTVYLQGNVLVSMKMERQDMWINLASLISYLVIAGIGVHFVKSLTMINYSIFASFIIFHLLQDRILIRKGITTLRNVIFFYVIIAISVLSYIALTKSLNPLLLFSIYLILIPLFGVALYKKSHNSPLNYQTNA